MKKIEIKCNCAGGEKTCGRLVIEDLVGELEFSFIPPKRKKAICNIVLFGKDYEKLLKFLKDK